MRRSRLLALPVLLATALAVPGPAPASRPAEAAGDPMIAAAGDIACDPGDSAYNGGSGTGQLCRHRAVADVIARLAPAAVLPLGDEQYEDGQLSKFRTSYASSWGQFLPISRPVPGNHEYETPGAAGYFDYFGSRAGTRGKGYYSYNLGTWHVIALNSNCAAVGCGVGSAQELWLRRDLAANPRKCTLAYWHHPRFSSGPLGDDRSVTALWNALYRFNADVVLSGHDHHYERFAPMRGDGVLDHARGLRSFVVGTGGASLRSVTRVRTNSHVRSSASFGALQLALRDGYYGWRFLPAAGGTYTDGSNARCH